MKLTVCRQFLIKLLAFQSKILLAGGSWLDQLRSRIERSLEDQKAASMIPKLLSSSVSDILNRYSPEEPLSTNRKENTSDENPLVLNPFSGPDSSCPEWERFLNRVEEQADVWKTPNLAELMKERTSSLQAFRDAGTSPGKIRWACEAVDFYDELASVKEIALEEDLPGLDSLGNELERVFRGMGVEILRSSSWNPEMQRAVAVEKTLETHTAPVVKEQGASGVRVDGRLVRKQEVVLQTSMETGK